MNGRRPFDHPRARGTNPRARATNPRAAGTNPHPGKSEQSGQWRAAWRRIDRMAPEDRHKLAQSIRDDYDDRTDDPRVVEALARLERPGAPV